MNRSTNLLARISFTVTLLAATPLLAEAGSCEDSPARCTRPVKITTAVAAVTGPAPPASASANARPAARAQVVKRTVPAPSVAPAPVAVKKAMPIVERTEKPAEKSIELKVPAVPGLGTLLRMSTGTHDEISWFRGPRDRDGTILT